jgi:polar amino acid transport system permease protein
MLDSFSQTFTYLPDFLSGMRLTALASVLSFILAFSFGVAGALCRRSRLLPLRWVGVVYVEVIRNTPVLVQIFLVYFGLPFFGIRLSPFKSGVVALSVNAGAYLTEILRAGLAAVPPGQVEAARSVALNRRDVFRFVVFPQAVRFVYPPVVNQFVQIILGSSLLSAVTLHELTYTAKVVNSQTLQTLQVFTVALVLYLILTNLVGFGADLVGRAVFHPPLRIRQKGGTDVGLLARLRILSRGA